MSVLQGLESLENPQSMASKQEIVRIVITSRSTSDSTRSTCRPQRPGGALLEPVDVERGAEDLHRQQLQHFVDRFPIGLPSRVSAGVVR